MITEPGLPSVKSAQEDDCHLYDKIYHLRFIFGSGLLGWTKWWTYHLPRPYLHFQDTVQGCYRSHQYLCIWNLWVSVLSLIQLMLMPITKQRKPIWPLYGETFDLDEDINVSIQHRLDLSFIYLTIQRAIKWNSPDTFTVDIWTFATCNDFTLYGWMLFKWLRHYQINFFYLYQCLDCLNINN